MQDEAQSRIETFPRRHRLKTWPVYWDAVHDGRKPFAVRDFREGDLLLLERWGPSTEDYCRDDAGNIRTLRRRISYVLPGGGFGIADDVVVLGMFNRPAGTPAPVR